MNESNIVVIVKWVLGLIGAGVSVFMSFYIKRAFEARDRKRVLMECKIDTSDHMFTDHLGDDVGGEYTKELGKRKSEAGVQ